MKSDHVLYANVLSPTRQQHTDRLSSEPNIPMDIYQILNYLRILSLQLAENRHTVTFGPCNNIIVGPSATFQFQATTQRREALRLYRCAHNKMLPRSEARRRRLTLPLLRFESAKNLQRLPSRSEGLFAALSVFRRAVERERTVQTTIDQQESPLCQLPFEIRQMIWKEALGSGIMHITHLESRLGHARCTVESENKWAMSIHDCWGRACCLSATRQDPSLYVGPIHGVEEPQNLLGLMMSCRTL